jgi:hypothetical protein
LRFLGEKKFDFPFAYCSLLSLLKVFAVACSAVLIVGRLITTLTSHHTRFCAKYLSLPLWLWKTLIYPQYEQQGKGIDGKLEVNCTGLFLC